MLAFVVKPNPLRYIAPELEVCQGLRRVWMRLAAKRARLEARRADRCCGFVNDADFSIPDASPCCEAAAKSAQRGFHSL